jgi:CheY-like chemotaxis protein
MQPARSRKVEMSVSSTANSAAASGPNGLRPATILVAEDHLDSRDALRALLEAVGYHVLEAVNGRQAIDVALACDPDLILMDIMMPELDGFEATRELRRHELTSDTPIIAVTAMEGAQQLAIQAGANDFVRKPVDIRGLVAKVHDWLEPLS